MNEGLSFQITNDLLFADVIVENADPTEVQRLVQARLSQDKRFREKIVHLAHGEGHRYADEPICHQVGHNLKVTLDPTQVTCLRCLNMHLWQRRSSAQRRRNAEKWMKEQLNEERTK